MSRCTLGRKSGSGMAGATRIFRKPRQFVTIGGQTYGTKRPIIVTNGNSWRIWWELTGIDGLDKLELMFYICKGGVCSFGTDAPLYSFCSDGLCSMANAGASSVRDHSEDVSRPWCARPGADPGRKGGVASSRTNRGRRGTFSGDLLTQPAAASLLRHCHWFLLSRGPEQKGGARDAEKKRRPRSLFL